MEFTLSEIAPKLSRVVLQGRGDAAGISTVETRFTASIVGAGSVVLDMGEVPFMGSLGIRMLLSCGRVMSRRGAKLVLFGVQPMVMEVFETMALPELIPVVADEPAAVALATA